MLERNKTKQRLVDAIIALRSRCRLEEHIAAESGLTVREVTCLCALGSAGSCSAGLLAEQMDLSPSRTSRVVASLRSKGLLIEDFDSHDRRAVTIELTPSGHSLLRKVEKKKDECERRLRLRLSPDRIDTVQHELEELTTILEGGVI